MNKITPENFQKIWEECREDAYKDGDLYIDDWTKMCEAISEFSKERGIEEHNDGDIYDHPEHLAFIKGAQWAFKYLKT